MSDIYETTRRVKLYDEDIHEETTLNLSSQGLIAVPKIKNQLLCVRYWVKKFLNLRNEINILITYFFISDTLFTK